MLPVILFLFNFIQRKLFSPSMLSLYKITCDIIISIQFYTNVTILPINVLTL